jgi:hypothetical protein
MTAFANNPNDPLARDRALRAIQMYVFPCITKKLYNWQNNHQNMGIIKNETLFWLVNASGKNDHIPLLEIELDMRAASLMEAFAKPIYNMSFKKKLPSLSNENLSATAKLKRLKNLTEKTANEEKLKKLEFYSQSLQQILQPVSLNAPIRTGGGKTFDLEAVTSLPDNDNVCSLLYLAADYSDRDPDKLLAKLVCKHYPCISAHKMWLLRSKNPELSIADIAKKSEIDITRDTKAVSRITDFWRRDCLKLLHQTYEKFRQDDR